MERLRLVISLAALATTIALALSWNAGVARAGMMMEGTPECNCIDGFSKRDGFYSWDPDQKRYRCVTGGCYVIAFNEY